MKRWCIVIVGLAAASCTADVPPAPLPPPVCPTLTGELTLQVTGIEREAPMDSNTLRGLDLDDEVCADGSRVCTSPDFVDPDGTAGVDSALWTITPTLEGVGFDSAASLGSNTLSVQVAALRNPDGSCQGVAMGTSPVLAADADWSGSSYRVRHQGNLWLTFELVFDARRMVALRDVGLRMSPTDGQLIVGGWISIDDLMPVFRAVLPGWDSGFIRGTLEAIADVQLDERGAYTGLSVMLSTTVEP